MTNLKYGVVVAKITVALEQLGAMTCNDVSKAIGVSSETVRHVLSRMHKDKRLHISAWTNYAESKRVYPRAVYDLGEGKDKVYVKAETISIRRKYDVANAKQAVSSVFDLGMNRAQRTEKLRKLSLRVNASAQDSI